MGNASVDATRGLVLLYGGVVVNAPYHANCGGSTAAPQDSWRAAAEPYLQRVSDQIPGTSRYYCDQAPRFRWTRTFAAEELRGAVARYVRALPGGAGGIGAVTSVAVTAVTPAGRVGTLTVDTDRGRWSLRGNEIRTALRSPAGELLYSTYFSVDVVNGRGGVQQLLAQGRRQRARRRHVPERRDRPRARGSGLPHDPSHLLSRHDGWHDPLIRREPQRRCASASWARAPSRRSRIFPCCRRCAAWS